MTEMTIKRTFILGAKLGQDIYCGTWIWEIVLTLVINGPEMNVQRSY